MSAHNLSAGLLFGRLPGIFTPGYFKIGGDEFAASPGRVRWLVPVRNRSSRKWTPKFTSWPGGACPVLLPGRHIVKLRGRGRMNGLHHDERHPGKFSSCERSPCPQVNLRIIHTHQERTLRGNKRLANAPAHFVTDGDILQVGVAGGQSSVLVLVWLNCVDAAGLRIYQHRQSIDNR